MAQNMVQYVIEYGSVITHDRDMQFWGLPTVVSFLRKLTSNAVTNYFFKV